MTQGPQRPSEAAMRFAVKWHQALQLDAMGVEILAKAYDEDANTRIESGVVAELVAFIKEARDEFYHSAHSSGDPSNPDNNASDAYMYREAVRLLANLEASK